MADIKALRSYLVSLGFSVNTAQAAQFNKAVQTADQLIHTSTANIVTNVAKWSGAIVGMFEAVGAAMITLGDKAAMADQEYRFFGQRMFMDTQHAKSLKIAIDALGISLEQAAFDPESHRRLDELLALQKQLQPMLGGDFATTMVQIRDTRQEFTKFRVEVLYFRDLLTKQVFQALGGEKLTEKLRQWNEYIIQHIPEWSRIITTYIVPVLKDAWMILKDLWQVAKDFAQIFSNIVGFLSGDPALEGTVSFEKFAHALEKVANWLAILIHYATKFAGTIAGAGLGFMMGGPAGAAIGASVGGLADIVRSQFGQGGTGTTAATEQVGQSAIGQTDNVRALAAQVGANLGVNPATIYAQWAHETGNFSNRGARSLNNLAGIRLPGSTEYRSFSSLSDFGNYYTGLIQRRYPGAVGAQSIEQYAGALKSGGYFEDSLKNYTRGMHGFENAYGGGSTTTIGSINIMQPHATPDQIQKAVSDAINQKQRDDTSVHLNELRALYG